jgi:hypothetical protein
MVMTESDAEYANISYSIVSKTKQWMLENPNGNDFDTLQPTFDLLLDELMSRSSWSVTSVKCGDQPLYYRKMKNNTDERIEISDKINILGKMKQITTTTDICHILHRENKQLSIWNKIPSSMKIDDKLFWNIEVGDLVEAVKKQYDDFRLNIKSLNNNVTNSHFIELKRKLTPLPSPKILAPSDIETPDHAFYTDFISIGFKIYIAILTILEPDWKRISMLPSVTPTNHLNLPGGLVICEEKNIMTYQELELWQTLACIPFWPWLLTARTAGLVAKKERLKLFEVLEAMYNDYRNIEYLFGCSKYTLTDSILFDNLIDGNINNKQITLNKINKFHGIEAVLNVLKLISDKLPVEVRSDIDYSQINFILEKKDNVDCIVKSSSFHNEELVDKIIIDLINYQKLYKCPIPTDFGLRTTERRKKNSYPTTSPIKSGISIIVPILPTTERISNFKFCLKSYNYQTIFNTIDVEKKLELIILLDRGGELPVGEPPISIEDAKEKKEELLKEIENLPNLKKIKISIFISTHDESIGRSSIRNYGIYQSEFDIIQLFDDSIVLEPNYLLEILVRFNHLMGQKIAIVGFKQNLAAPKNFIYLITILMISGYFTPDSRLDWKKKEKTKVSFSHPFISLKTNEFANYMELTGNLCFLNGKNHLGHRDYKHFFSTGMVAFWKEELINAGGFHPDFNIGWGYEDGHLGAVLFSHGNKIIPCFSALAIDLSHLKDKEKEEQYQQHEPVSNDENLFSLLHRDISEQNCSLFDKDIKKNIGRFIL